jgi:type I restriction enzyme S subunit
MSFPRYPKYKASGVEWLGDVPEGWEVKPVRQLAAVVNGFPFDSKLFDAAEGIPLIRIRDLNQSKSDTCYNGEFVERAAITSDDVLVGMDGDFNVGRWLGEGRALLNQRMCCIRGKTPLLTRLLEYSLPFPLKGINEVTYATTVKHLASSQIEKTFVALPPIVEEQTAIAEFLDRETGKIDELVAEQRRLMELLKEKRQAVISHAVTKGLNPHAPMKPSGIEWLGDVPAHWEVMPLKRDLDYLTSGSRGWAENYSDHGELFIRIANLTRGTTGLDLTDIQRVEVPEGAEGSRTRVKSGDVLFSITAYLGSVAVVPHGLETAYVSQHIALARLRNLRLSSRWVGYAALSVVGQTWFDTKSYGGTKVQLSLDDVRDLPVPVPPMEEQIAIVAFLDTELVKLDTLTAEAQRAIDLLQERRTALISAAVTGQIDVRKPPKN